MRKIALILFIFLVGCGGREDEPASYNYKIENWKIREVQCPDIYTVCPDTGDLYTDIKALMDQIRGYVDFDKDPEVIDYWESSCEVSISGGTDCDDFAALAYRTIISSCLEKSGIQAAMRMVRMSESIYHMVVIVYQNGHTFTISNLSVIDYEISNQVICEFSLAR